MLLTRYDSNRLFNHLTLNALNHDFFKDFSASGKPSLKNVDSNDTDWVPQVDIQEQANQYLILADIPGIDPKDIEITLDKGVLAISGKREFDKSFEQNGFQRVERFQGRFIRCFSIPDAVDQSRISAKGKNGVLELIIPKAEKALPRKITVTE